MTDISTYQGVTETWGDDYVPEPWSAEYVVNAVVAFFSSPFPYGVRSVFPAEPRTWVDPANFYGDDLPWGASLIVQTRKEKQLWVALGDNGERGIRHPIRLKGTLKTTLTDTGKLTLLERRVEDGIKEAIRKDASLGGRVQSAGTGQLESDRSPNLKYKDCLAIEFYVDFDVIVGRPAGS